MSNEIIGLKKQIQLLDKQNQVLNNCWQEAKLRASKNQENHLAALRKLIEAKEVIEELEAKNAELKQHLNPVESDSY